MIDNFDRGLHVGCRRLYPFKIELLWLWRFSPLPLGSGIQTFPWFLTLGCIENCEATTLCRRAFLKAGRKLTSSEEVAFCLLFCVSSQVCVNQSASRVAFLPRTNHFSSSIAAIKERRGSIPAKCHPKPSSPKKRALHRMRRPSSAHPTNLSRWLAQNLRYD